jgi:hypothetical protein
MMKRHQPCRPEEHEVGSLATSVLLCRAQRREGISERGWGPARTK